MHMQEQIQEIGLGSKCVIRMNDKYTHELLINRLTHHCSLSLLASVFLSRIFFANKHVLPVNV